MKEVSFSGDGLIFNNVMEDYISVGEFIEDSRSRVGSPSAHTNFKGLLRVLPQSLSTNTTIQRQLSDLHHPKT